MHFVMKDNYLMKLSASKLHAADLDPLSSSLGKCYVFPMAPVTYAGESPRPKPAQQSAFNEECTVRCLLSPGARC